MSTHRYGRALAAPLLAGLSLTACIEPPDYSLVPDITSVSISRDSMVQGAVNEDSITVTVAFTDGDGDIGGGEDTAGPNVFLVNTRNGLTVASFKLDEIPDRGLENGISGRLALRVYTTCCDYPEDIPNAPLPCTPFADYPVDTLLMEAYIVDRAGQESDRENLPPVYLLCDQP